MTITIIDDDGDYMVEVPNKHIEHFEGLIMKEANYYIGNNNNIGREANLETFREESRAIRELADQGYLTELEAVQEINRKFELYGLAD